MSDEKPPAERALYIVMRSDLGMPRGKEIAQAIHGFHKMDCEASNDFDGKMAVICVRADDEEHLNSLVVEALSTLGHEYVSVVKDAARTVFPEPTITCACIGPVRKGRLIKLSEAKCY